MSRIVGDDMARFMSYVAKTDDCWMWAGSKNGKEYGVLWFQGRLQAAHRVAFQLFRGVIPEGMQIDHRCFVHECVNPAHLRAVTHKENQENRSGARQDSSSGIRGVYFVSKSGKWRGEVRHHGRCHSAGTHATSEEAADAVKALRLSLFTHSDTDRNAA